MTRLLPILLCLFLASCGRRGAPPQAVDAAPALPAAQAKPAQTHAFDHNQADHAKLNCESCHKRRAGVEVTPRLPYHDACVQCHAKESYLDIGNPPALCHTCHSPDGVLDGTQKARLIAFPNTLRQFGLKKFSHGLHLDAAKMPRGERIDCVSCHRETAAEPVAFPSHPECYRCHAHQGGEKLGRCEDCHVRTDAAMAFSHEPAAATRDYNFTHKTHRKRKDGSAIACQECHGESDIARVAVRRGLKHESSCWGTCHIQKEEPVCGKCHKTGAPRPGGLG